MKTRIHTPETEEAKPPGRMALMADAYAQTTPAGRRPALPRLEWQALLLRYLPEPMGTSHSVKRFAAR